MYLGELFGLKTGSLVSPAICRYDDEHIGVQSHLGNGALLVALEDRQRHAAHL